MNFYQRFLGDYMRDTGHLSLVEHGAYSQMLDTYYATERPLPADYEPLFRICKAMSKTEREAVRKVADQFFPMHEDGLRHNRRADLEIARAKKRIEAAHENGSKGGRPKDETKQKPGGLSVGNQNINPSVTKHEPNGKAHQNHNHISEPQPSPQKPSGAEKPAPSGSVAFSRYAGAYRKRYRVDPVRNAKTNAQFVQLVKRLGATEAAEVAEFYVFHNSATYVRAGHAVNLLVRDAEKIRTEWATGQRITETAARQADRKENNLGVANQLLAEAGHGRK